MKQFKAFREDTQGFGIIGVVVSLILLFAVLVPVTNTLIWSSSTNLSGTASTVAQILPLLEVVGGLLLIVGMYQRSNA